MLDNYTDEFYSFFSASIALQESLLRIYVAPVSSLFFVFSLSWVFAVGLTWSVDEQEFPTSQTTVSSTRVDRRIFVSRSKCDHEPASGDLELSSTRAKEIGTSGCSVVLVVGTTPSSPTLHPHVN